MRPPLRTVRPAALAVLRCSAIHLHRRPRRRHGPRHADRPCRSGRRRRDDRGGVTVEAAIALGAFGVVLAAALGGVAAAVTQVRCVDAAREAARLAALGDLAGAQRIAALIAPGSSLAVHTEGAQVRAEVDTAPPGGLIPGLRLSGEAFAFRETDAAADQLPADQKPADQKPAEQQKSERQKSERTQVPASSAPISTAVEHR